MEKAKFTYLEVPEYTLEVAQFSNGKEISNRNIKQINKNQTELLFCLTMIVSSHYY